MFIIQVPANKNLSDTLPRKIPKNDVFLISV